MDVATLLATIEAARAEFDALLAQLDDGQFTSPRLSGGWSPKDLLAHVAWFEQEMVELIQTRTLAGSDLWQLPADARNAAILERNRDRHPAEVRAAAAQTHAALRVALTTLTDEALHDSAAFANMPANWEPWLIIAQNSYAHYEEHTPQLQAFLAQSSDHD